MSERNRCTPALEFLLSLATLERVPLHYLFGDPEALPRESLRFFHLDLQWIEHLLLGALSATGEQANEKNLIVLRLIAQVMAGQIRDPRIPVPDPPGTLPLFREIEIPQIESSFDSQPVVGFLLRSALVPRFPAMGITALDENGYELTILVKRNLATDVLFVLFCGEGRLDQLILAEPAWGGLAFGVDPKNNKNKVNKVNTVTVYQADTKVGIDVAVPVKDSVIDIIEFAKNLAKEVKGSPVLPAGSSSVGAALTQAPYRLVLTRGGGGHAPLDAGGSEK